MRGLGLAAAAGVKRLPFRSNAMGIPFLLPSLASPSHPTLPVHPWHLAVSLPETGSFVRTFVLQETFCWLEQICVAKMFNMYKKYSNISNICLVSVDSLPIQYNLCLSYS